MKLSTQASTLVVASSLFSISSAATAFTLVTFGDSYTDQSRVASWFGNHSAPPPHYQEVYPGPNGTGVEAANGGTSWVRYAGVYGGFNTQNYAVSGAACSNNLTPRYGNVPNYTDGMFPSVTEYEIPAFLTDFYDKKSKSLGLRADETVYSIWVGTNDVGIGSLLTGNQTAGVTIVNVTECVINWAKTLYSYGARNFLFQNMVPLELSPLYGVYDQPLDRYWPYPRNRTQYATEMRGIVNAGNALWDLQVPNFANSYPGVKAAVFDSNSYFRDIYYHPQKYFNGTQAPLNVTGYCAHSDITGANTVVCNSPDSFMWYDSLHPSEETDRNLAREIVKAVKKESSYTTFYGNGASWPKL